MDSITRAFTEHPAAVGETWGQHFTTAFRFALSLQVAALAALVHAILPFMFVKTSSRIITALYGRMVAHRTRGSASGQLDQHA
ncbi:MAG: DUF6356 family protein [Burkholderiaceae bacterium]